MNGPSLSHYVPLYLHRRVRIRLFVLGARLNARTCAVTDD